MNARSLKKLLSMMLVIILFSSAAEAGQGATKVYKISVTLPAMVYTQASSEQVAKAQDKNMQIAMEKGIRNNETVMVKTTVAK